VKDDYLKSPIQGGSFIQTSRRGNQAKSSFKRQQDLQKGRSSIQKNIGAKKNHKAINLMPVI
jgi:hypothetical protein